MLRDSIEQTPGDNSMPVIDRHSELEEAPERSSRPSPRSPKDEQDVEKELQIR